MVFHTAHVYLHGRRPESFFQFFSIVGDAVTQFLLRRCDPPVELGARSGVAAKFVWHWREGTDAETTLSDFGSPTADTDYELCVFTRDLVASGLARLPAGLDGGAACNSSPCWKASSSGFRYRDSTGSGGLIGPGDVQWMTAASGILHDEFHSPEFTRTGGSLEMVQLWVNLPAKDKMSAPGYQTLLDGDIPAVELAGNAGRLRVIAGDYKGHHGPARTFTPIDVWDVCLRAGHTTELTAPEGRTFALVVLHGAVLVNGQEIVREAQMVMLDRAGTDVSLEANSDATLLVLSGDPIDEPIVGYGPFVMNTQAEIQQAIEDFNSGRFGQMPQAA